MRISDTDMRLWAASLVIWLLILRVTSGVDVDDEASLITAIETAEPNSEIVVLEDVQLTQQLHLNVPNLTLRGVASNSKVKIVCPEEGNALLINETMTIYSLEFTGCQDGSALNIPISEPGKRIEVTGSSFTFNILPFKSGFDGAAIKFECINNCLTYVSQLDVSNSTFEGNQADQGGAIYGLNVWINVKNSEFQENIGNYGGSAIYARRTVTNENVTTGLTVYNTHFTKNEARRVGLAADLTDPQGKLLEIVTYHRFRSPVASGGACLIKDVHTVVFSECHFRENAAAAGGALSVIYDASKIDQPDENPPSLNLTQCKFHNNKARWPVNTSTAYTGILEVRHGGALFMMLNLDAISIRITACDFEENAAYHGGAIHILASNSLLAFIKNCQFKNNSATALGGAVLARYIGVLQWDGTDATDNRARQGGAVFLTNHAGFRIAGLPRGGEPDSKHARSFFENNLALDGGAIMCTACGNVNMQDLRLFDNKASRYGGGVYVLDHVVDFVIQYVEARRNEALVGGFLASESSSRLIIDTNDVAEKNVNTFVKNTAVVAGAVYYRASRQRSNRLFVRGANFSSNNADTSDTFARRLREVEEKVSGEAVQHLSKLAVEDTGGCKSGGGGAICMGLSKIPLPASVEVSFEYSVFEENRATIGGAAYMSTAGSVWNDLNPDCLSNSERLDRCRRLQFFRVNFTGNSAQNGGGAAFVSDPDDVFCMCDAEDSKSKTLTDVVKSLMRNQGRQKQKSLSYGQQACTDFSKNTVIEDGTYGPEVATEPFSLDLIKPLKMVEGHRSGDILACGNENQTNCTGYVIWVKDKFGQRITGGHPAATLEVTVESLSISGTLRYSAKSGEIKANGVRGIAEKSLRDPKFVHNITFKAVEYDSLKYTTNFTFRKCQPGEYIDTYHCRICSVSHYSFKPTEDCRSCEDHANCTGGAVLAPIDGYWHSTPFSPLFHQCLIEESCSYEGRSQNLTKFFKGLKLPLKDNNDSMYQQCRQGYSGFLCAACKDGYGRLSDGRCGKCQFGYEVMMALLVLMLLWIFFLVAVEVATTMQTNLELKALQQLATADSCRTNSVELKGHSRRGSIVSQGSTERRSYRRLQSDSENVDDDDAPKHIATSENFTELIKVFVNFLQITGVAVSMNLHWGRMLGQLLRAQDILATVTDTAAYFPIECTFGQHVHPIPPSIVALWMKVAIPFVILFFFLLLGLGYYIYIAFKQEKEGTPFADKQTVRDMFSYFIVVAVAVSFFAYKDVTEELMRTISCFRLDTARTAGGSDARSHHPYGDYAKANDSYWTQDSNQKCWQEYHLVTGIAGVLGLVFFSIGTVVFNIVFLLRNKPNLKNGQFISRYGFLYRSYKDRWYTVPWEAVISIRKALISAVVVFALPLGPNLQALMVSGVLIFALSLHLVCMPFKKYKNSSYVPDYAGYIIQRVLGSRCQSKWIEINNKISLNHLEASSLLVSASTFLSGNVLYDGNTSKVGGAMITIFAAGLNLAFITYCLYRIYHGFHVMIDAIIANIKDSGNRDTDFEFAKGNSFLGLIRRVNQLCVYWYRDYSRNRRAKPGDSLPDSVHATC